MPLAHPEVLQASSTGGMVFSDMEQEVPPVALNAGGATIAGIRPPGRTARPSGVLRNFQATPLHLLTIGLLDTYKRINENYYESKRRRQEQESQKLQSGTVQQTTTAASNDQCDDKDSDYIIIENEIIYDRYRLSRRLGKGSFGQVALAYDTKADNREVAVKIIKSKKPFTKQADTEIRILKKLNELDPTERGCVVRLLDTFMHRNHRCLVFEKLSMNLYDLLRSTRFTGVSFDLIRKFARQILVSLKFFAQPNVNIIHCDLKPENILLVEPKRSALKVIDFGSSCTTTEKPFVYIQSRFYRSPEVMLGCNYGTPIDMWSLGCILIEMHSGTPLYSGQTEMEQMYLLVGSKGMPPEEMLRDGKRVSLYFESTDVDGHKHFKLKDLPQSQSPRRLNPLTVEQALGITPNSSESTPFKRPPSGRYRKESFDRYLEFADLLNRMLTYSPAQRITPSDALNHPFLQVPPSSASVAPAGSSGPSPPGMIHGKGVTTSAPKRPLSD